MVEDLQGIRNRVAVVTGASRGIGQGLVEVLARAGARVAMVSRNGSQLEEAAAAVRRSGGQARAYECDLRDTSKIQGLFDTIEQDFGMIDVLVNNAGMGQPIPAVDISEADWDRMMSLNMKAVFFCAQAAARSMLKRGWGRIINMSSQAGFVGIPHEVAYCASKGGVNMMTKALALELAPHGITVNAVAPTFVRTPGTAERLDDPAFGAGIVARIPVGRVATIGEVGAAVLYFASEGAAMTTGTVLLVDGGWTAQ